jgi:hypothetical protein
MVGRKGSTDAALVYQLPPRTTVSGYKAAEWNVENFVWKGRLRVVEVGERCELKLEVSGVIPSYEYW